VHRRTPPWIARGAGGLSVLVAAALALSGCAPSPEQTSAPSLAPATTAPPSEPTLVPGGTAEDNLPVFTAAAQAVWDSEQRGEGKAYIDALIGVGFDREAMQLTKDVTTVGNPVESLQFSVRWGESECLVGQVGPSTGALVAKVLPQLAEGRCLVGATRPIDW
jgi:hypothetical protein